MSNNGDIPVGGLDSFVSNFTGRIMLQYTGGGIAYVLASDGDNQLDQDNFDHMGFVDDDEVYDVLGSDVYDAVRCGVGRWYTIAIEDGEMVAA